MPKNLLAYIALSSSLFATGCQSMRYGGAPEPSFDVAADLKALQDHYGAATSIDTYYSNPSIDSRNKLIAGRLVMINLRYVQFVRATTTDKQLIDSASDILVLSLNLAGTAFADNTAKTALAAIAAGIGGTKVVIDKEFYYEKTIPALVSAMNAQRRVALIPILEGTQKPLNQYTVEQAISDLQAYYEAGTFIGALQTIQAESGVKEASANETIAQIVPLETVDIDKKAAMSQAIKNLTDADLPQANAALRSLNLLAAGTPDLTDRKQAAILLQRAVRESRTPSSIAKTYQAFTTAGLIH